MARVLVGTSGWGYGSWRGPFFPMEVPAKHQPGPKGDAQAGGFSATVAATSPMATPKEKKWAMSVLSAGAGLVGYWSANENRRLTWFPGLAFL
jgi:hypothetical protein